MNSCINLLENVNFEENKEWKEVIPYNLLYETTYSVLKKTPHNKLCPPMEKWFNWLLDSPNDVKVVIIGQDPYQNLVDANGLAFSSDYKVPPSLRNIYMNLIKDGLIPMMPSTGDLTCWKNQGVLLLNAALSTEVGIPTMHMNMWVEFTDILIRNLSQYGVRNNIKMVFMLWGRFAQRFKKIVDFQFHLVLETTHPSPLAQSRIKNQEEKFENCKHFMKANIWLKEQDREPINWSVYDTKSITK